MLRTNFLHQIRSAFQVNPVVAILGPRQCGKTTLARDYTERAQKSDRVYYFDLESPSDLARLEHPHLALEPLKGLVAIDEVQRAPRLFETLRVLVDRKPRPAKFLILGSASRDLLKQSSETLAGRISYLELTPFTLEEIPREQERLLWIRGGFPRSFLSRNTTLSARWRRDYVKTYLERDLPSLGIRIPSATMRRFWMMLSHYHGQIFNASEIGKSLGLAHTTVRHHLDILSGTFMVRELQPWQENIAKRQVKSPKIFFRDSGIYHSLLGINDFRELLQHPKMGASWEGFALEEIIRHHRADPEETYFWATHNQAELDLLILKDGKRIGYEVKYTDAPRVTKSMRIAQEDLHLDELHVVFPGKERFPLDDRIDAVGLGSPEMMAP